MAPSPTNEIARVAAQLLAEDETFSIAQAVQAAQQQLGLRDVPLPGAGLVRQHCRARAQAAMGEQGYQDAVREHLVVIAQLMESLVYLQPSDRILLMGRAAKGLFDGPGGIFLRLYSEVSPGELARSLVELGYQESTFKTADTRHGRMSQLCFEEAGLSCTVTLIRSGIDFNDQKDLFTGKPVASADRESVQAMIESSA